MNKIVNLLGTGEKQLGFQKCEKRSCLTREKNKTNNNVDHLILNSLNVKKIMILLVIIILNRNLIK